MREKDKVLSEFNYEKQAQDYYSKVPAIILGSGASAAHGMPDMGELAKYLIAQTDVSDLPTAEMEIWKQFCHILEDGTDLETALHQEVMSEELTSRIIKSTWTLLNNKDIQLFKCSFQNNTMFPLSELLGHMLASSIKTLNIVTTNYDRLAEYACDQRRVHHYTGFTHGFFRQLAGPDEIKCSRKANIWKVHGSLDWFQTPIGDTIAISGIQGIPENYKPQIVTPGLQKYQKTHLEPFRSIISNADAAIKKANSYLCIGYGFNDEHVQPELMAKCQRESTPITIITYSLSESAKKLIHGGKIKNYLAIERGATDGQSVVYSSLEKSLLTIRKDIWSLKGYLSLIT